VLEAFGGAHHWGRWVAKLGHRLRLNPAAMRQAIPQARQERPARHRAARGIHRMQRGRPPASWPRSPSTRPPTAAAVASSAT
jgi:hypothetical protein